jgi:hypothetical protein
MTRDKTMAGKKYNIDRQLHVVAQVMGRAFAPTMTQFECVGLEPSMATELLGGQVLVMTGNMHYVASIVTGIEFARPNSTDDWGYAKITIAPLPHPPSHGEMLIFIARKDQS